MKPIKNSIKASSIPEYLIQQKMENQLNQSYNKMLLALHVNAIAQLSNSIQEPEKIK